MAGRPERVVDPGSGPVAQFAFDLNELRHRSGLKYRQLAVRAHYDHSTLSRATAGRKLPSLAVTKAFVKACGAGDPDVQVWISRWREVHRLGRTRPVGPEPSLGVLAGEPCAGEPCPDTDGAPEPGPQPGNWSSAPSVDPLTIGSLREFSTQLWLLAHRAAGPVPMRSDATVLARLLLMGASAAQLVPVLGMPAEKITAIAAAPPTEEQWDGGRGAVMDFVYDAGQPFSVAYDWAETYASLRRWRPDPNPVSTLDQLRELLVAGKDHASLSYADIARATHGRLARSTAHLILTGERTPRPEQVELLLTVFGVGVDHHWRQAINRAINPPVRQRVVIHQRPSTAPHRTAPAVGNTAESQHVPAQNLGWAPAMNEPGPRAGSPRVRTPVQPAAWMERRSTTGLTVRLLRGSSARLSLGEFLFAAVAMLAFVAVHILAAIGILGAPGTGGEGLPVTAAPAGPVGAGVLAVTDRFAAHQITLLAGLLPGDAPALDTARWSCLLLGGFTAVLLWPLQRRLGLGRPVAVIGVTMAGTIPPALALHTTVTAAAPAAMWLTLAAVLAVYRAHRATTALAAALAVATAPLTAVVLLGFTAHVLLDRSYGRALPHRARIGVGALLATGATTITALALATTPTPGTGGPALSTPIAITGAAVTVTVSILATRSMRWLIPLLTPTALLLTALLIPGPTRTPAALLVLPLLAFLSSTLLDHHIAAAGRRRPPPSAPTRVIAPPGNGRPDRVAGPRPRRGTFHRWLQGCVRRCAARAARATPSPGTPAPPG